MNLFFQGLILGAALASGGVAMHLSRALHVAAQDGLDDAAERRDLARERKARVRS